MSYELAQIIEYSHELDLKEHFTKLVEPLIVNVKEEDLIYLLNKITEFNKNRICRLSLIPYVTESNITCHIKLDILDEIFDNTYLIKKGVRDCYSTVIDIDLIEMIKACAASEELFLFPSSSDVNEEEIIIFIYKEPHMQILFNMIDREEDEIMRQTLIGHVLGYKDMEKYLNKSAEDYKKEIDNTDIEFEFDKEEYPNYFNFIGNVTHNNISKEFILYKGVIK